MNTQNLIKDTDYFLGLDNIKDTDYKKLIDVILFHNQLYYLDEKPVISDFEYDKLYHQLKNFESENPDIVDPKSPSQKIEIGKEDERFTKKKHLSPMISLDNTYNEEELKKFFERTIKTTEKFPEVIIQTKLDGTGISLIYENGELIRAVTRGNGIEGEDVTHTIKTIKSIPHKLKGNYPKLIEVRGEILMPKSSFQRLNKERQEKGESLFANPRNAASGSIRQLDAEITRKRDLIFFAFHIGSIEDKTFETGLEQNNFLQSLGIPIDEQYGPLNNFEEVYSTLEKILEKRQSFEYEIDGAVIKLNEIKFWKELGETAHHPKWAIAFKYPAEQAQTILKDVVWQVGRTGVLTPRAFLEPVQLSGATVSHATLHNKDEINEKDFRVGDTVLIERAGDVIPHLLKPIIDKRNGNEKKIDLPKKCPSCGENVFYDENEVAIRCINESCPAQIQRHLEHFVSKQALNIENISEKTIELLLERDLVKSPLDIFDIEKEIWLSLPLHKEKKVENILKALEGTKNSETWRIIHALGINNVGKKTAQVLSKNETFMNQIFTPAKNKTYKSSEDNIEKLKEITDIGPETANSINAFFSHPRNQELLERFDRLGFNLNFETKVTKEGLFTNKKIVLTGTLPNFSREEATEIIESQGGEIVSSVSKNTDYILLGENPGSKLEKGKKLGIEIIGEEKLKI